MIVGTKSQLKLTASIFWTKFVQKCISGLKQKNPTFARVHGYLLYQIFRAEDDGCNVIIMPLLLLVAETNSNRQFLILINDRDLRETDLHKTSKEAAFKWQTLQALDSLFFLLFVASFAAIPVAVT